MLNDSLKTTGQVSFVLTDENGLVKETRKENLVVTLGKSFIAQRILAVSGATSATATSGSIANNGTVLTVAGTVTGTIRVGDTVTGTGIAPNTVITSFGTGTGGTGTYNLSVASSPAVSAVAITCAQAAGPTCMGVGSGGTTAVTSDTALTTEIGTGAVRVPFTAASTALVTTNNLADAVQWVSTFNPGTGTGAIIEAGIFNNTTVGQGLMFARTSFPVINKGVNDTLTITWKITVAAT